MIALYIAASILSAPDRGNAEQIAAFERYSNCVMGMAKTVAETDTEIDFSLMVAESVCSDPWLELARIMDAGDPDTSPAMSLMRTRVRDIVRRESRNWVPQPHN